MYQSIICRIRSAFRAQNLAAVFSCISELLSQVDTQQIIELPCAQGTDVWIPDDYASRVIYGKYIGRFGEFHLVIVDTDIPTKKYMKPNIICVTEVYFTYDGAQKSLPQWRFDCGQ